VAPAPKGADVCCLQLNATKSSFDRGNQDLFLTGGGGGEIVRENHGSRNIELGIRKNFQS
jgi:hypothetical protein